MSNPFTGAYVHVIRPIGETYHARCTADLFDHDVLTVSSLDDGATMRVYQPGEWRSVHVSGGDGQAEFGFVAEKDTK